MEQNLLIVDDNAEFGRFFEIALKSKPYKITTASSAEEALDLLARQPCLVMFIDLNLPGMNGIELCRRVKADFPIAICHAITGYTSIYSLLECRMAGFDDLVVKPCRIAQLHQITEDAFKKLDRWMTQA